MYCESKVSNGQEHNTFCSWPAFKLETLDPELTTLSVHKYVTLTISIRISVWHGSAHTPVSPNKETYNNINQKYSMLSNKSKLITTLQLNNQQ